MSKIKSALLISSEKQNKYLYDKNSRKAILCHPLFYYLLKLQQDGTDLDTWLHQLPEGPVKLEGCEDSSKEELYYYYRKYQLFKKNGYFEDIDQSETLSARMNGNEVKEALANVRQVAFETTDRCNLECEYCGYGKYYNNYDRRDTKELQPGTAKHILDHLLKLWNSPLNHSHQRLINISFYGGEPLMNFPFIREVTGYARCLNARHNRYNFSMTTNGLLLEKYMDFLVEHDFSLLVSLDGDRANNEYRVLKNGKPAFDMILRNVKALKQKYPGYFKKKVSFNAVLHNKNSVSQVFDFIRREFDKTPRVGALNTSGVAPAMKKEFWKMYSNFNESLYKSEDYSLIEKEMFTKMPDLRNVTVFLNHSNDSAFNSYNDLLYPTRLKPRYPTGTCPPFSQKIFVTVNGKILACERIGQSHVLGYATPESFIIDYDEVAQQYNNIYDGMRKQCHTCYNADYCIQCIFNLDLSKGIPRCKGSMTRQEYSRHLALYLDYVENKPEIYVTSLKDVVIH